MEKVVNMVRIENIELDEEEISVPFDFIPGLTMEEMKLKFLEKKWMEKCAKAMKEARLQQSKVAPSTIDEEDFLNFIFGLTLAEMKAVHE